MMQNKVDVLCGRLLGVKYFAYQKLKHCVAGKRNIWNLSKKSVFMRHIGLFKLKECSRISLNCSNKVFHCILFIIVCHYVSHCKPKSS